MYKIIDGKNIATELRRKIKEEVEQIKTERGISPKLVVVLVGDDAASQIYVRNKERACAEVGILSEVQRIPSTIKESELIEQVRSLNNNKNIHGILVQLPLPKHLNEISVLNEISPDKDVDGLHPLNMGKLLKGEDAKFIPCTAAGIMELILSTEVELMGKEAVVVGRSNIVGKPTAILLLKKHATVTICHSRTRDLGEVTRRAEVLIAAVGSPAIIKENMVKGGAIIIDVGMNRLGEKLVGDVDYEFVKNKASFITPVPGGVGPMTIAMLLKNTLLAVKQQNG
jgi:methylenetetrahydrofolate dehydrogenase (NADP+)/methenyltetrahydrofolate cyclohydrolase